MHDLSNTAAVVGSTSSTTVVVAVDDRSNLPGVGVGVVVECQPGVSLVDVQGIKAGPLPSLSACARVVDGGSLADLATSSILAATGPPDGGDVALLAVAHGHAHTGGRGYLVQVVVGLGHVRAGGGLGQGDTSCKHQES